jgi:serine/threonine protein kinase/tetratricopeptide (TPR) repeat protein
VSDRSERLTESWAELAGLPDDERRARIERIRRERPELADELSELLALEPPPEGFLEPLEAGRAFVLLGGDPGEEDPSAGIATDTGLRVGPYLLGPLIGRGGMGVVHLAERVEGGFQQRVAVKLVRPGGDRRAITERFRVERQILARLGHANVARLLDGGLAPDGRPYFALEYVDGRPITGWCDERRLDVAGRLRLFLRVCDAVRYAHSNLIVHRDLKPSNILVDTDGQPKLLDFGIAKVLEGELPDPRDPGPEGTHLTLTPEYAAPEQLLGGPVTTATDVYSLGIVLHELLTGGRPGIAAAGIETPSSEADEATDGARPDPPSRRVLRGVAGEPRAELEKLAQRRGRTARALSRRLAGDLDAIVLRALEPDPERRYGSAEGLAADLRRHLEHRWVEARQGSALDRTAVFVRRHRLAVAASAAVAAALAVGTWVAALQARRAGREASQARAALGFLGNMLESADPSRSLGGSVTARELLDRGARNLLAERTLDPVVHAQVADMLARTYRGLGRLDEAARLSREATATLAEQVGDDDPRTRLAEVTAAEILVDRGELAPARARLDVLIPRLAESFGPEAPESVRARALHASVLGSLGEFDAALTEERQVLDMVRRRLGPDHLETAERLGSLAFALAERSRFDEAEKALREALAILGRNHALGSPQAAEMRTGLAEILDSVGRDQEAADLFRQAIESARATLGPRHPQVAETLIKQGFHFIRQHRSDEAEAALREAIGILEPIGHFDAGSALRYLGFLDMDRERFAAAHETFARAETFLSEKLGPDHPLTWSAVVVEAYSLGRMGRVRESERRLREAVDALIRIHGRDADDVRVPRKYLGEMVRRAGRPAEAAAIHRDVLALERRLFGTEEHVSVATSKERLAEDLLDQAGPDELAEARTLCDESLAYFEDRGARPVRVGRLLTLSGRIAAARGHGTRARADLARGLDLLTTNLGPDAPSTTAARRALAKL